MPNLRAITSIINATLQMGSFSTGRFQGGQYNELAQLVMESDKDDSNIIKRPMIVNNNGQGTDVIINDKFPIQVYHRTTSLNYEQGEADDFGDAGTTTIEIAEMIMIIIGDRKRLKVVQEDLAASVISDMPIELQPAQLAPLFLTKGLVDPIDVNTDIEQVYDQEYSGVPYLLKPSNFMLSFRYRITTEYSVECFNLCLT